MKFDIGTDESFSELRKKAGYSIEDCVKNFGVCLRTVRNWEQGKNKPPRAVFLCLMVFDGRIDFLGSAWRGFKILPDCIVSPENEHIWHYEIKALSYVYQAAGLERYRMSRILTQSTHDARLTPTLFHEKRLIRMEAGYLKFRTVRKS